MFIFRSKVYNREIYKTDFYLNRTKRSRRCRKYIRVFIVWCGSIAIATGFFGGISAEDNDSFALWKPHATLFSFVEESGAYRSRSR